METELVGISHHVLKMLCGVTMGKIALLDWQNFEERNLCCKYMYEIPRTKLFAGNLVEQAQL